jgi:hypothetical protein
MTNRTFQFFGLGYASNPVDVTINFDNNIIYQGVIPTNDTDPFPGIDIPVLWCTGGEVPVDFTGSKSVSITANNGILAMAKVLTNYNIIPNPIFTPEQFAIITTPNSGSASLEIMSALANPPFTPEEITILLTDSTPQDEINTILALHGVSVRVSAGPTGFYGIQLPTDCRTNVSIDGIPTSAPTPRPDGLTGDWYWIVPAGSTITFDLNIVAGVE